MFCRASLFLLFLWLALNQSVHIVQMAFCNWRGHQEFTGFPGCLSYFICLMFRTFINWLYICRSQDSLVHLYLLTLTLLLLQNQTLIAVKAPHGTTLEVPDPDEVSLFQRLWKTSAIFIIRCQNVMIICFSLLDRRLTTHKGDTGSFLEVQWDLLTYTLSGIYASCFFYLLFCIYIYIKEKFAF